MGECNLDQIECLDFRDYNYLDEVEEVPSRWDMIRKNADIPGWLGFGCGRIRQRRLRR